MAKRTEEKIRYNIKIKGIVQGVGFRPFVYNTAKRFGLSGYVLNDSHGVEIEIEGLKKSVEHFFTELESNPPVLSCIIEIKKNKKPLNGYNDFKIKGSKKKKDKTTLISPDMSICEDCQKELFSVSDRRYFYPFINCTNCGPRYSIIKDIPYDRINTTMHVFEMCEDCRSEYNDPEDRRFHAQPNGCFKCGPELSLLDNNGEKFNTDDPIDEVKRLLKNGKIIAVKGIGGFHLCCDAYNDKAVKDIRKRKRRYQKPFALMSPDIASVEKYAVVGEIEKNVLNSPQKPVVLLSKRPTNKISENVAPFINSFGVMLPYTPLHYLILKDTFDALVMTSGNISEEPISIDNEEAVLRLKNIADYFLVNNRDICVRSDDSVVRIFNNKLLPIRRARGFVPIPVFLKNKYPEILACGAMLKNTFCILKGNRAFISQHIGDLENLETLEYFEETIDHLKKILEVIPEIIVVDKHPDYISTRFGEGLKKSEIVRIQHHFAHIVSCMVENGLSENVIGIALDGTGYGDDGKIWGGEVLIADLKKYKRAAHLNYMPLPGGDKAIVEPWRIGLAYLIKSFGEEFNKLDLNFLKNIDIAKQRVVRSMIENNINSPETSSCGRLFDAVSAIIGIRNFIDYEGQAAIELENLIQNKINDVKTYNYFLDQDENIIIDIKPLIRDIMKDYSNGSVAELISFRFHRTLSKIFRDVCLNLKVNYGIDKVVLSGGCFQNLVLLNDLKENLERSNFIVYNHTLIPPNDGGISLGQAVAAGELIKN
ncbi:carbamoyltransferase HypF [candidate division KSB1 bacterium]